MVSKSLLFKAGPGAFEDIKRRGFSEERIGTIAGASGGAKWLSLSQMDRVIASRVLPKLTGPVHLIGSSIGAWRFACYAQSSPFEAIERFERLYLEQSYSERRDADEISRVGGEISVALLGESGVQDIVNHPNLRLNIMTVRCHHLTASDVRPVLIAGRLVASVAKTFVVR